MNNFRLNLLTLPFWWYTAGWQIIWSWNKRQFALGLRQTGLSLFIHHLREPLYGDYTRSGILLGIFFRFVLLIIKLLLLLVRLVLLALATAVYLGLLPGVLTLVIYQIAAL